MARRLRTRRTLNTPNTVATIVASDDDAFESIREIFEDLQERQVLMTSEGNYYLVTTDNDKLRVD